MTRVSSSSSYGSTIDVTLWVKVQLRVIIDEAFIFASTGCVVLYIIVIIYNTI